MVNSHPLCRNNPFVPYKARPGPRPCVLQYPESLETAVSIIRSISNTEDMVRQCISCHRYLTGAPRPDLGHGDAPSGPECSLPHHPSPCPWVGPRGQPCPYIPPSALPPPPVSAPSASASSTAPVTTTVSNTETPSGEHLLLQELQQLRREREEEARRVEQLTLANSNLRESQARLSVENSQLRSVSSSMPQVLSSLSTTSVSSTSTTATTTTSSLFSRPSMGVGYSAGFGGVIPSVSAGVSSVSVPLAGAAQALAARNIAQQQPPHSIPGYGGPSIPDLRSIPQVNALAQQFLGLVCLEIPALATHPSFPSPAPPPVSSFPPIPPVISSQAPAPGSVPSQYPDSGPSSFQQPQLLAGSAGAPQPSLQHLLGAQAAALDPTQQRIAALQSELDQLRQVNTSQVTSQGLYQTQNFQTQDQVNQSVSLDSLLSAKIKFKQYSAYDFAKLTRFPCVSQLKSSNMNLALFSYGSIEHLLSLSNGTLPPVSKEEYNSRLQHILNVLEIACLGSVIRDFDSHSWRIAREYDSKILQDISMGFKTWLNLDKCIDSSAWQYARELVPPKAKSDQISNKTQNPSQKLCTTFNTFRKDGCSFEFNNPGEQCVYLHACSKCRQKGYPNRPHKAINCRDNAETKPQPTSVASTSVASVPVTSV